MDSNEELEIGVLITTLLMGYVGIKTILGSATFLATAPSSIIGTAIFSVATTLFGIILLALAYGIYEAKKWAWIGTLGFFGLLVISDIINLISSEFSILAALTHVFVVGYLLWDRESFLNN